MVDQASQWWLIKGELARLFDYLVEHDLIGLSEDDGAAQVSDFLRTPWSWSLERGWMIEGKAPPEEEEFDVDGAFPPGIGPVSR